MFMGALNNQKILLDFAIFCVALLENSEMLRKYGLTDEEVNGLDFT